jgi:hypothetical protein
MGVEVITEAMVNEGARICCEVAGLGPIELTSERNRLQFRREARAVLEYAESILVRDGDREERLTRYRCAAIQGLAPTRNPDEQVTDHAPLLAFHAEQIAHAMLAAERKAKP